MWNCRRRLQSCFDHAFRNTHLRERRLGWFECERRQQRNMTANNKNAWESL
jgi:hypothetical protein